jgi:hypothetical protein
MYNYNKQMRMIIEFNVVFILDTVRNVRSCTVLFDTVAIT